MVQLKPVYALTPPVKVEVVPSSNTNEFSNTEWIEDFFITILERLAHYDQIHNNAHLFRVNFMTGCGDGFYVKQCEEVFVEFHIFDTFTVDFAAVGVFATHLENSGRFRVNEIQRVDSLNEIHLKATARIEELHLQRSSESLVGFSINELIKAFSLFDCYLEWNEHWPEVPHPVYDTFKHFFGVKEVSTDDV